MNEQYWTIHINENEHRLSFWMHPWSSRKHVMEIDGYRFPIYFDSGNDQLLTIDGKEVHLVYLGMKADIAVDGVYVDSGKKYSPMIMTKLIKYPLVFLILIAAGIGLYKMQYQFLTSIAVITTSVLNILTYPLGKITKIITVTLAGLIIISILLVEFILTN